VLTLILNLTKFEKECFRNKEINLELGAHGRFFNSYFLRVTSWRVRREIFALFLLVLNLRAKSICLSGLQKWRKEKSYV